MLAVDPFARVVGATLTLGQADLEDLPRVVPVVHRGRDVQPLVALEPNQPAVERGGEGFRDLGLSDAGLAFDEERLAQTQREEERHRERPVRDVPLALERIRYIFNRRDDRHAHGSDATRPLLGQAFARLIARSIARFA